jgi:Tol biopolymer transport system component
MQSKSKMQSKSNNQMHKSGWGEGILICLLSLWLITSCTGNTLPDGMSFQKTKHSFEHIDWSPNGRRLVGSTMPLPYSGINIGWPSSELYVWDPADDSYVQVSDQEFTQWNSNPAWSPQGDQILYLSLSEFGSEFRIGIVDVETMTRTGVSASGRSAVWFPDGERIAVENGNVCILEFGMKRCIDIWAPPRGQGAFSLVVSPDGLQIAALTDEVGPHHRLFIIDSDGKKKQMLLEVSMSIRNLDWSPDGQWLTFNQAGRAIGAIQADGSCRTEPLVLEALVDGIVRIKDIKWSPDGRRIAVSVTWEGRGGVFFFDTQSELIHSWLASGDCSG